MCMKTHCSFFMLGIGSAHLGLFNNGGFDFSKLLRKSKNDKQQF